MTTDKMPKADPGVHRRAGSINWQRRIKAPLDLRSQYPTLWAHRVSPQTPDLGLANHKAADLMAH